MSEEAGEVGDSGEYNVYSTFQSHEPDFDYLKSLEIEEKINKIRWLPQQNAAHFLLSTNGEKHIKLLQEILLILCWVLFKCRGKRPLYWYQTTMLCSNSECSYSYLL